MPTDVVFALRRTDLPDEFSDLVWTDQGPARHGWVRKGTWQDVDGYDLDPQPSCWYDLRPSDEPLTTDDLRHAIGLVENATRKYMPRASWDEETCFHMDQAERVAASLRAALDALTVSTGRMGEPPEEGT